MRTNEKLSHQEIMSALSDCFRELIQTDVTHRSMPNIINRGKAAAQLVSAMHREQIMEARRLAAQEVIIDAEEQKKLKKIG